MHFTWIENILWYILFTIYFECVCVFVSDYGSVYPLLCDAVPASCVGSVTMLLSHSTFLLHTRHTCRTTVSNLWCTVSPAYTLCFRTFNFLMLVKLGLNLNLYINTYSKKPLQSDFPFNVTTFAVLKKVKLMSHTWALSVWISLYMYNN